MTETPPPDQPVDQDDETDVAWPQPAQEPAQEPAETLDDDGTPGAPQPDSEPQDGS